MPNVDIIFPPKMAAMATPLPDPPSTSPGRATLLRSIPVQIADALAFDIIEERYAPGERLNEIRIAAQWDVSRSPVREALRLLEARGLVVITPQRGARVSALSVNEVEQLFEIRAVLVGLSARRAASTFELGAARRLDALLGRLEQSLDDAARYEQASAAATLEIAAMGGSPPLTEMIVSFAHRIGRYARIGLGSRARRVRSLENWRALFAAIRAADGGRAEEIHRRQALENRDEAVRVLHDRISQQKSSPITHHAEPSGKNLSSPERLAKRRAVPK
jgi:DNA-binding GntR family transcriptional regulator